MHLDLSSQYNPQIVLNPNMPHSKYKPHEKEAEDIMVEILSIGVMVFQLQVSEQHNMRDQKGSKKSVYLGRRFKKMVGQLPMEPSTEDLNQDQILALKAHQLCKYYCEKMRVTVFNEITEGMLTQSQ